MEKRGVGVARDDEDAHSDFWQRSLKRSAWEREEKTKQLLSRRKTNTQINAPP